MSYEFFDTLLWVKLCRGMEKYTSLRARFFVRKKYNTTFNTERIVALRSVNKIFPESYDFAANVLKVTVMTVMRYDLISIKDLQAARKKLN
jgi:hypothetical protein